MIKLKVGRSTTVHANATKQLNAASLPLLPPPNEVGAHVFVVTVSTCSLDSVILLSTPWT